MPFLRGKVTELLLRYMLTADFRLTLMSYHGAVLLLVSGHRRLGISAKSYILPCSQGIKQTSPIL